MQLGRPQFEVLDQVHCHLRQSQYRKSVTSIYTNNGIRFFVTTAYYVYNVWVMYRLTSHSERHLHKHIFVGGKHILGAFANLQKTIISFVMPARMPVLLT